MLLILGCFVVIAGIGSAVYWQRSTHVALDTATMCPLTGPLAVHAILLDRSDTITPLQAERIRQVFDRIVEGAAVGERVDLYVLAADGTQALAPTVSMCRPRSDGNDLYENAARLRANYANHFKKPLEDALAVTMTATTEPASPIMESVKAVCVAAFGDLPTGAVARLTIASDMIQYSPLLNQYRSKDFDTFKATPAYRQVLADCHGAKVDVLYLVRPKDSRVQDRRHQLFWEKFFDHENATLMSMEVI